MRQNTHCDGALRHLEAKTRRAVADVKAHAALQRAGDGRAQFARRRKNAVRFAVVAVGDDVARTQQIGNFIEVWRIIADMHHQRQAAILLLHLFCARQRCDAVFTDHAAAHAGFQANDKIRVALHGLLYRIRIDIGHVRQLVLSDQPDAGNIQQRENRRAGFAGDFVEIVHIVGTGTARVHDGRDASRDTDAVRLIMINRGVGVAVNVRINPARADKHFAVQLDGFVCGSVNLTQRRNFAVLNGDVSQRIVGEARAAQE
ncbi:hypothetical protein D3C78_940610 [compost metagenome]